MTTRPHILVAVDLTTRPQHICHTAADLAARLGARVTLLHVVELPAGVPGETLVQVASDASPEPAARLLARDSDDALGPLTGCFRDRGVPVESCSRRGDVAATIRACADELDALLVVVGDDVPSGLRRLVTQGLTAAILRQASRPVLVVPRSPAEADRGRTAAQLQAASEADG